MTCLAKLIASRIFDIECSTIVSLAPWWAAQRQAIKNSSLVRVKRGMSALGREYHSEAIYAFAMAQSLLLECYISSESALAYHGWRPEAVYVTASISSRLKTQDLNTTDIGQFGFHPPALLNTASRRRGLCFVQCADRVRPGRCALMNLLALRKARWPSLDWLVNGMRIDEGLLVATGRRYFTALNPVYKHKAMNEFLDALENSV